MLVGLPVAAIVYIWACRSLDLEADQTRASNADLGLDPGIVADAAPPGRPTLAEVDLTPRSGAVL
jgi:hypothetical protein